MYIRSTENESQDSNSIYDLPKTRVFFTGVEETRVELVKTKAVLVLDRDG